MMTVLDPSSAATALRARLGDRILLVDDADYDVARTGWNLAVDQRPFAVARPETPEEAAEIVSAAVEAGLRVAPQNTGHGAGALANTDLSDAVLVSMSAMRAVSVDSVNRTAMVEGGATWSDVLARTAPLGLTALHGSAGTVGVVGYALSGGLSFYVRAHGLAVGSVLAVDVITADGRIVHASGDEEPDLFWAVRGGSGAFGLVVAVELALLPYADVYAGMLLWDATAAPEVAAAWAAWTRTAPETASTSMRVMHFPPLPELPPFLSGRDLIVVDGAILESDADADELLAPLRALEPEMDTFARIPAAELVAVHMDPPDPTPAFSTGVVLSGLPDDAVAAFLAASATPGLFFAELRHIGGAGARRPEGAGAVGAVEGDYLAAGIALVPGPDLAASARGAVDAVVGAFAEWRAPTLALTFVEHGLAPALGFGAAHDALRRLKEEYDPTDVFAAGVPVD